MTAARVDLPPLPRWIDGLDFGGALDIGAEMRAYATAAILADRAARPDAKPVVDTSPRKIGGPFIPHEIARNARNAASGKPILYLCPAGCGCTWRDNDDGSMSLGLGQRSCEVCEFLPLGKLVPLYAAMLETPTKEAT